MERDHLNFCRGKNLSPYLFPTFTVHEHFQLQIHQSRGNRDLPVPQKPSYHSVLLKLDQVKLLNKNRKVQILYGEWAF